MHIIQNAIVTNEPLEIEIVDGEISVRGEDVDCTMTPVAALETARRIIVAANNMRMANA